jgi:hypothetical protein
MLTLEKMKELRKKALAAVDDMLDGELKTKAFEVFLQRLIDCEIDASIKREYIGDKKDQPAVKGKKSKVGTGPKFWLEELIEEGFFKAPKNIQEILKILEERAHHLKNTDLQWYLTDAVKNRKLRRRKQTPEKGGKKIYHYSNW